MIVFHISQEPDIEVFEPRKTTGSDEPLVWAIDNEHLRNYLAPRDRPRVTYSAGSRTTVADRERFLGSSVAVMAIETGWVASANHRRPGVGRTEAWRRAACSAEPVGRGCSHCIHAGVLDYSLAECGTASLIHFAGRGSVPPKRTAERDNDGTR